MFENSPQPEKDNAAKPPNPLDVLLAVLSKAKHKPSMFPSDPTKAAQFWIAHQEPPNEYTEAVRRELRKDGSAYFVTPYHDRIRANLKIFLTHNKIHQVFIIEAIERGIPWRGDRIEMFVQIVKQGDEMAKGHEAYIANASKVFRQLTRRAA